MIQLNLELTESQAAILRHIIIEYLTDDLLKVPFDLHASNLRALKDFYCVARSLLPLMQEVERIQSENRSYSSPYDCYSSEDVIFSVFRPIITWMPSEDAIFRSEHDDN